MPELPEGTINAFIQNKNLAKYGLLKDNEGGFLEERNHAPKLCAANTVKVNVNVRDGR